MSTAQIVLEARALSKRFGPTRALDHVDLIVRAGEVVALMGANGAGKSTVVNILSGVLRADSGTLELCGRAYEPASTQDAKALGVATMHQAIADAVVPTLSVAENLRDQSCGGRRRIGASGCVAGGRAGPGTSYRSETDADHARRSGQERYSQRRRTRREIRCVPARRCAAGRVDSGRIALKASAGRESTRSGREPHRTGGCKLRPCI
ncbi:ATP-binding cassette domain-containing protein [Paraburkholderia jirisanensis]